MTQHEERTAIFAALRDYGKKYRAQYYCVILTPEGQKVEIPGNQQISSTKAGEYGIIIEDLVEKEVLNKAPKRY